MKYTKIHNADDLTKNERNAPDFSYRINTLVFSYRELQEFYAASHTKTKRKKFKMSEQNEIPMTEQITEQFF